MQFSPVRVFVVAIAVAFVLAGCAATKIVTQWSNPDYASPRFKKILVIGVSKQPSIRRTFEEEFVNKLKALGVDAVPSYLYITEDGQVDEARLNEAVKKANADAVIITRLVRVEKKTEVSPGFYQPAPAIGYGFYGGYSSAWLGYYEPPRIYEYEVYISETSLYDVTKNQMVWTGTAETTDPGDIGNEIKRYVDIVVDALKSKKVLPS
ncbi:MAG TPA: hypothetical protein VHJ56_07350 [Candidatus Binatia bacterium]|nr:hypothetical protein [Candidatus Binatia bacterium]